MGSLVAEAIAGLEPDARVDWRPIETHSVLGFGAGAASAVRLRRELATAARAVTRTRPDLVVLVGYAGFNLPLGMHCRSIGVPTLFLSPPQVWAWGMARAALLRRSADAVCCLFAFEERLLRARGVNAFYFGYPLLDHVAGCLAAESVPDAVRRPYVAFFPGSRPAERRFHTPLHSVVFERIRASLPGLTGVIVLPEEETAGGGLAVARGARYAVMRDAACAVLASGTVTLEAAIAGTPMIVTYHLSRFSRAVAGSVVRSRHFALPNILAGKLIVPEFLDPEVEGLAPELARLVEDAPGAERMRRDLAAVRSRLGPPGAMARVAQLAVGLARRGPS
jgi:lipid-A-disaccharide synthase